MLLLRLNPAKFRLRVQYRRKGAYIESARKKRGLDTSPE